MWRLWWEDGGNCANVRVYASNQVCFANILPLEADHKELGAVRVEKEGSKKKKKKNSQLFFVNSIGYRND